MSTLSNNSSAATPFSHPLDSLNTQTPKADLLPVVLSILPSQEDPTSFLKEINELLRYNREEEQVRTEAIRQAQVEAQSKTQAKAQAEAQAIKRLVHLVLNRAKELDRDPYKDLPPLKSMTYDQLCKYIMEKFPELNEYVASIAV